MRIEQLERDTSVVDFTTRLLAGLLSSGKSDVIRGLLRDALPWVIFLPEVDVDTFVTELVTVTRGAVELGNLAPVAVLLTQWRHSAEVYADPVLLEILTTEPEGEMGPVSRSARRGMSPRRGERAAPPPIEGEYDLPRSPTLSVSHLNWPFSGSGTREARTSSGLLQNSGCR